MIGLGISPGYQWAQGDGGGSPGPTLASLPATPAARWHPGLSSVVASAGRVVSASDLMGLAALTEGGPAIGPKVMTDALGRPFWRFENKEFLNIASSLVFASTRATAVFLVGRVHRADVTQRFVSAGNNAAGSVVNTGGAMIGAQVTFDAAPLLGGNNDVANRHWMMAGSQLQVLGDTRRTTALGGNRQFLNRKTASNGSQSSVVQTNVVGGEVGRHAFSPGTSGNWAMIDLYELVIYNSGLTDSVGLAVSTALADHYAIPEIAHQLILDGDSITQGTGAVNGGLSCGMVLTDPGAGLIPANWRVVNMGTSGAQIAQLLARRDATNSWAATPIPGGQNVMAFEIGRNDSVSGGQSAAQHYANVTAYLNTASTGVLQRGWTVRVLANIAGTAGLNTNFIGPYRALIRAPQFLTDTQTQTGGAFAGQLSIISTDQITDAAQTIFLDGTDAADPVYYAGDNTHPSVLGARLRTTGGDTPGNGIAAGLV